MSDSKLGLSTLINAHLERFFKAHKAMDPNPGVYYKLLREFEAPLFQQTLAFTKGNQVKAAKILGMNRNTLRTKLQYLSIDPKVFEGRE